jgi:hypothetical protein
MKIMSEPFSVFSDIASREVHIVLAGIKVSFTEEEARGLASELERSVARLAGTPERPAVPALRSAVGGSGAKPEEAKPGVPDVDSIVGKMRLA